MDDTEERPGATRISRDGQNFGKALLDIINDILHFSEIEASKLELEVIHFNLRDCVGTVLQPLALSRAEKKWLKLRTDIGATCRST
jgi:signal transduction histidine kinase